MSNGFAAYGCPVNRMYSAELRIHRLMAAEGGSFCRRGIRVLSSPLSRTHNYGMQHGADLYRVYRQTSATFTGGKYMRRSFDRLNGLRLSRCPSHIVGATAQGVAR